MRRILPVLALSLFSWPLLAGENAKLDLKPEDPKLLPALISQSGGQYTKLADQVYQVTYKGKNLGQVNVKIAAASRGIFFYVDLVDRKQVPLTKNLLLKIMELNSTFDYIKIVLSERSLSVRLDALASKLTAKEFQLLESQTATSADEVYGIIKDFLP